MAGGTEREVGGITPCAGSRNPGSGLPGRCREKRADSASGGGRLGLRTIQRFVPSAFGDVAQGRLKRRGLNGILVPILRWIRGIGKLGSTHAGGVTRSANIIRTGDLGCWRSREVGIA